MTNIRIIPRIDIKGPNLVKGIHLEGLRVLGKPADFARYYYENGADELLYMDVVASLYERNSLHDIISETVKNIFIPLTVGGGLRTVEDIKNVLRAGADKVSLNTAAIKNPEIIREASKKFGSSTIVVAIEAIKQTGGDYFCFIDNGREYTGMEVTKWAKSVEELGAGEIIITSVDKEGTGKGFDLELIGEIADKVGIPVIAHGGAGKLEHFEEVIKNCDIDAVCGASIFHYDFIKNHKGDYSNSKEGNFDFLLSGESFKNLETTTITGLKSYLISKNVKLRK
jgi:cyclase